MFWFDNIALNISDIQRWHCTLSIACSVIPLWSQTLSSLVVSAELSPKPGTPHSPVVIMLKTSQDTLVIFAIIVLIVKRIVVIYSSLSYFSAITIPSLPVLPSFLYLVKGCPPASRERIT